ncbi:MAG: hypothetical protein AAF533_09425 [Acidobacteriota bacterium]
MRETTTRTAGWALALSLGLLVTTSATAQGLMDNVTFVGEGPAFCQTNISPLTLQDPTHCVELNIECPNTLPKRAYLRITGPAAGTTLKGTIIFGTGGPGTSWYERDPPARKVLNKLVKRGFRVIQRAWESPGGWMNDAASTHDAACRYASLITFIHAAAFADDPTAPYCATGNSGGSAELGYALSRWGRGDILDMALMTGGPPLGSMVGGCLQPGHPLHAGWLTQCVSSTQAEGVCLPPNTPNCAYTPNQAANRIDATFNLVGQTPCQSQDIALLEANSVLFPGADLDYPDTFVSFLLGEDDCTAAMALSIDYIDAVFQNSTGPFDFDVLPLTGHNVHNDPDEIGARAIADALEDQCVLRH